MLAGYLPFDDDPANPEGDNINLLYRYITSTPLTFPEYVTPHARDLLRRILVPDPRRRADLFEVARHSWLSEYHHVVSHITSSTTNITDIQNTTIPHGMVHSHLGIRTTDNPPEDSLAGQHLNRSASVREPAKTPTTTSPIGAMTHNLAQIKLGEIPDYSRSQRDKATRHTLQPEYVAPQSHTTRSDPVGAALTSAPPSEMVWAGRGQPNQVTQMASRSKPLPQDPPGDSGKVADYVSTQTSQQMMPPPPPPSRPAREIPHSASVTTGTFGVPTAQSTSYPQVTRPSTSGSMPSANETRSDIRLPSRGSYGQPVAPTVAATNAEGRVTQPKNNRGYNISGPLSAHTNQASLDQPEPQMPLTSFNQTPAAPSPQQPKKGHSRASSALSGLGERIFGRSASTAKRQYGDAYRQRNGRKYPPVSLKNPYLADNTHRTSIDSKRSFSLGFGRKRSTDLESQEDKPSRRFSLIPPSMSFKGIIGSNREQGAETESPMSQIANSSQPPMNQVQGRPATGHLTAGSYESQEGLSAGHDGQYDQQPSAKVNNFSRLAQSYQQHQQPSSRAPNDVYGSTGVYAPNDQYQDRSYLVGPTPPAEANYRHPNPPRPQYPDGFNSYDPPRPSMQHGRGGKTVLQKNNRKFVDAYNHEHGPTHHEGSSGPAKKVMDFFRRRGRAGVDDFH
jgi:protein-serine/threonine kinase